MSEGFDRSGFVEKELKGLFRKNGGWIQVIVVDKKGKERFYIMKEVDSMRVVRKDEDLFE